MKQNIISLVFIILLLFQNTKTIAATSTDAGRAAPGVRRVILGAPAGGAGREDAHEAEERRKYEEWKGRYPGTSTLRPDALGVTLTEYQRAFGVLSLHEKPSAGRGEIYGAAAEHKHTVTPGRTEAGTAYVGPDKLNYVINDTDVPSLEAHGRPVVRKAPEMDKGEYSRDEPEFVEVYSLAEGKLIVSADKNKTSVTVDDTEIVFDPGHEVDHKFTITYKGSNSTRDPENFTPQNLFYNRRIRNPLAQTAAGNGYTYKEFAIYSDKPLGITRVTRKKTTKVPLPEGFVFMFIRQADGRIVDSYYFPNLINYAKEDVKRPDWIRKYKFFAERYRIPTEVAADIFGNETIASAADLRMARWLSAHVGYRALSGRYEVLPEGKWPAAARAALIKTAAMRRMERAAEYDTSIENMLDVAKIFNDRKFKYEEFADTLDNPFLANYWTQRAVEEIKRKKYPNSDIFYLLDYADSIPVDAMVVPSMLSKLEENLTAFPNSEDIIKLLEYFDAEGNEDKYNEWSKRLSAAIKAGKVKGCAIINETNKPSLKASLSNTSISNVLIDFSITEANMEELIEAFRLRAINEQKPFERALIAIEFTNITPTALTKLFQTFEEGFIYNGKRISVDIGRTAIKTPYEKVGLYKGICEKFPHLRGIVIVD